ncbi:non-ribosomal peptide synthetase [Actinomadura violacea]|uniref:Amino acid adenylation domain-containing protein n=1 Tax=Actinomadura violacea TaxID=2819934 RepID=A0ABS3RNI4_9ACTN|nr:non-ribosomal peptide synthetase [Actinomadura violacea]MBO2458311.1 amino acid adenylation domain-containing protein [Actinomadura violacea]
MTNAPTAESLPALVAAQAAATPDAIAVEAVADPADRLTYRELLDGADALVRRLRARGVGPEVPVGICLERGTATVTALLAAWRAEAPYVPLDPAHPRDRLRGIVAGAGLEHVLADDRTAAIAHEAGARDVLRIDAAPPADEPAVPLAAPDPASAAYVLHTSGSTGTPKGVVITHEGIAGRVLWAVRRHAIGAGDRVLWKTPLSFDAAGFEVFAPLAGGATLLVAPAGAEQSPAALAAAVRDGAATVLQGVPTMLRHVAGEPGWAHCRSVRLVFSAGEPLRAGDAGRLLAPLGPDAEVWNTYGPTECSIDITAHRFDPGHPAGHVPIGVPIDGMRVVVLDERGELAPLGAPGELFAGGPGVARCYLGRPALTAERFVPDPFGPPGARLYRTGDRVRWRPDGVLEFLGRLDDQVKVRGVRIEPGEVEAALSAHPAVREAAVTVAAGTADGERRLVAHLAGDAVAAGELRAFLRDKLPEHFVPTLFTWLDALPRTSGGKLDRRALPAPAPAQAPPAPDDVPPATAPERLVAGLWSELLGVPDVGAHADFYELGGHSLLLGRLATMITTAAGRPVALTDLLGAPTVAAQARLLSVPAPAAGADAAGRDVGEPPQLSFGQQRLWLLDRMNPGAAEYVVPLLLPLPGGADAARVREAMRTLAERHRILRTRYPVVDGEPRPVVDAVASVRLAETRAADAAAFDEALTAEIARGFDLASGPVWRGLLLHGPGDADKLLLTVHHIACDGWSSAVLEREFATVYAALSSGSDPELPPLRVHYADHAARQRARLSGERLEDLLSYWRAALEHAEPAELPADRPRPPVRDGSGALLTFTVPADLAGAVAEVGRRAGATPYTTLLTAFAVLLARHTGRWGQTIGAPVSGRLDAEADGVVGPFLNTLVLRADLGPGLRVGEALRRMRGTVLDALAHQELPFELLVADLAPPRDPSRTPLFQVMFDLHEDGATAPGAENVHAATLQRAWRSAKTDLSLMLHRAPDGSLTGAIEYATALFDAASVRRIADRYTRLLASLAEGADDATLAELDLLPPEERRLVTHRWNATGVPREWRRPHELFADQVLERPGAIALADVSRPGGETLTYAELDARAEACAAALRAAGAGPETVVGVLLERGPDLLAWLLGVWRAGGAYVPLGPDLPAGRLGHMVRDSGARVVVAAEHHRHLLADAFDGTFLAPAVPARPIEPAPVPPAAADPGSLAYVMYTSGSTGRPKGVQIEHRALANLLSAGLERFGGGAWLALTAVTFDISGLELFLPLVSGGRVVLADERQVRDGRALAKAVADHGVTHVQATPSGWRLLLETGFAAPGVTALAGGEALPADLARDLSPHVGRLTNVYGPTETTIWSTAWPVPDEPSRITIGGPLQNTTAYVLDERMWPVPVGVIGELYLGGQGLARGYRGLPAQTAEKFVPDPFGPPGARLYRTGDLVRALADGTLEYLSRADDQVKIRGHRIEPAEVAAVLRAHPEVRDCVVTAARVGAEAHLVAYVVPAGPADGAPPATVLAEHCRAVLPDSMVPLAFVPLPELPLNPSGKVDRAALPDPEVLLAENLAAGPDANGSAGPPLDGPVRRTLAELWAELLGGPAIPHAGLDFFRLGGTSLLAARLVERIRTALGTDLPLATVFSRPTLADLADAVEESVRADIAALDEGELAVLLGTGRDGA